MVATHRHDLRGDILSEGWAGWMEVNAMKLVIDMILLVCDILAKWRLIMVCEWPGNAEMGGWEGSKVRHGGSSAMMKVARWVASTRSNKVRAPSVI